jgi:hypothetical protein
MRRKALPVALGALATLSKYADLVECELREGNWEIGTMTENRIGLSLKVRTSIGR